MEPVSLRDAAKTETFYQRRDRRVIAGMERVMGVGQENV